MTVIHLISVLEYIGYIVLWMISLQLLIDIKYIYIYFLSTELALQYIYKKYCPCCTRMDGTAQLEKNASCFSHRLEQGLSTF